MAADPSVSPADTVRRGALIRRDASHLLRSVVTYGGVKEIIGSDLYRRSLLALWSLEVTPDELLTENARLLAVGERDGRQIARFTEALEQIAAQDSYEPNVGDGWATRLHEAGRIARVALRAVLAGEEDAAT